MRKLATIQRIKTLFPIKGADRIELATFGGLGWQCVVKKGEFNEGDKCIYFEVDSLLPELPQFEFLRKSSWNNRYQKHRLRTMKMKGVLSQGLALPLSAFGGLTGNEPEGEDLTEVLGVMKYEPYVPAALQGDVNSFTWPIPKTDEERIQSNPEFIEQFSGKKFYSTVKLDGTSGSYILWTNPDSGKEEYHVCSRNHSIRKPEEGINTYWEMSDKYGIEERLKTMKHDGLMGIALQGEICGPGIQKNPLNLGEVGFFLFNMILIESRDGIPTVKRLPLMDMLLKLSVMNEFGSDKYLELETVPIDTQSIFHFKTVEKLLDFVDRDYKDYVNTNTDKPIEGMVFRLSEHPEHSFKVINNRYLLTGGDDE